MGRKSHPTTPAHAPAPTTAGWKGFLRDKWLEMILLPLAAFVVVSIMRILNDITVLSTRFTNIEIELNKSSSELTKRIEEKTGQTAENLATSFKTRNDAVDEKIKTLEADNKKLRDVLTEYIEQQGGQIKDVKKLLSYNDSSLLFSPDPFSFDTFHYRRNLGTGIGGIYLLAPTLQMDGNFESEWHTEGAWFKPNDGSLDEWGVGVGTKFNF